LEFYFFKKNEQWITLHSSRNVNSGDHRGRRRRRKGRGRRLTCDGSLAATRRLCRWLSGPRWKEWWPVSVAGEGRRKVAEERSSAALSLYKVFGRLLVMEMEFSSRWRRCWRLNAAIEREREAGSAGSKNRVREAVFWLSLDPNLSLVEA
jgi:hypothetical protein